MAKSAMAPGQKSSNSMQLDPSGDSFSLSFLCKGKPETAPTLGGEGKNEAYYLKQKELREVFLSFPFLLFPLKNFLLLLVIPK